MGGEGVGILGRLGLFELPKKKLCPLFEGNFDELTLVSQLFLILLFCLLFFYVYYLGRRF